MLVHRLVRRVPRNKHTAARARRVLAPKQPAKRLLDLDPAGRVQGGCLGAKGVQRGLVQERDDFRGLYKTKNTKKRNREHVSTDDSTISRGTLKRAFRRADIWSEDIEASHRRMQSRSFFSLFWASWSCRRAKVWYCGTSKKDGRSHTLDVLGETREIGRGGGNKAGRGSAYLNKSTRGSTIGHQHPHVVHLFVRVEPIDRIARELHELRPLLDREGKLEMLGAGVRYPHKHTPEEHVHTGVEYMQQA